MSAFSSITVLILRKSFDLMPCFSVRKYFWHIPFFVLYATKIGIIFDTTNISDKY